MGNEIDWSQYEVPAAQAADEWAQYEAPAQQASQQPEVDYGKENIFGQPEVGWGGPDLSRYKSPREGEIGPGEAFIHGAHKAVGDVGHGLISWIPESGVLGDAFKNSSKKIATERNENYYMAQHQEPGATMAGNLSGEVGLGLAGGQALGALSGMPKYLQYLSSILKGGVVGGITKGAATGGALGSAHGLAKYAGPEESRLENAAMGGLQGAAFGAAIPAVSSALKTMWGGAKGTFNTLKHFDASQDAKGLTDLVLNSAKQNKAASSEGYNAFHKVAEDLKIKSNPLAKDYSGVIKNLPKDEKEILKTYLKNPTTKNSHDAYKALGDEARSIKKMPNKTTADKDRYRAILDARKKIESEMFDSLDKAGRKDLIADFKELNRNHRANVVPYEHPIIKKKMENELTDEDFLRDFANNKKIKAQLLPHYPEIDVRRKLRPTLSETLGLGAKVGAGVTGVGYLKHLLGGE